jgi:hypothetical protein
MTQKETAVEGVRVYLRQLTSQTRAKLLAELERLQQGGGDMPGADMIIAELRAEALLDRPDKPELQQLDQAARHFFVVLEPYLVEQPPERTTVGRISRIALNGIWEWITRELMASMARDYTKDMKQFLAGGRHREAEQAVLAFQNKAVKYLEGTLARARGADQARTRLSFHAGSSEAFNELGKILHVLKARDALAGFAEDLPAKIDKLADDRLDAMTKALDGVAAAHPDAVPFALTLVMRRLIQPWQVIRFATKAVETKDPYDIAETPYAIAVTMAFDQLDDQIDNLRDALRADKVLRAKDILTEIYNTEYALRVRMDLEDSDWGDRLDATMALVAKVLTTETRNVPDGLNHILHSRGLRSHNSLSGQITRIGWMCRDALTDSMTYGRNLVSGLRK